MSNLNKAFEDVAHRTVAELFDMLKEATQERDKLKAEIGELLAFNENLDRERNGYRDVGAVAAVRDEQQTIIDNLKTQLNNMEACYIEKKKQVEECSRGKSMNELKHPCASKCPEYKDEQCNHCLVKVNCHQSMGTRTVYEPEFCTGDVVEIL